MIFVYISKAYNLRRSLRQKTGSVKWLLSLLQCVITTVLFFYDISDSVLYKSGRAKWEFVLQEDTADQESHSREGEELEIVEQSPTVKVMGMEMTASCESGQKCSRPTTPIIPTPPRYRSRPVCVSFNSCFSLITWTLLTRAFTSVAVMSRERKRRRNRYI